MKKFISIFTAVVMLLLSLAVPMTSLAAPGPAIYPWDITPDSQMANRSGVYTVPCPTSSADLPSDMMFLTPKNFSLDSTFVTDATSSRTLIPLSYHKDGIIKKGMEGSKGKGKIYISADKAGDYQIASNYAVTGTDVITGAAPTPAPDWSGYARGSRFNRTFTVLVDGKGIDNNGNLVEGLLSYEQAYTVGYNTTWGMIPAPKDGIRNAVITGTYHYWDWSPVIHLDEGVHDIDIITHGGGGAFFNGLMIYKIGTESEPNKYVGYDWSKYIPDYTILGGGVPAGATYLLEKADIVTPTMTETTIADPSVTVNSATFTLPVASDANFAAYEIKLTDKITNKVRTLYATTPVYTADSLDECATYDITVKALDDFGNYSTTAATGTFTTAGVPDIVAPTWPAGTTASAEVLQSSVKANWTAAATDDRGVYSYKIVATDVDEESDTTISDIDKDALTYTLTTLLSGTLYNLKVYAVDRAGNISDPLTINNVTTTVSYNYTFFVTPDQTVKNMVFNGAWVSQAIQQNTGAFGSSGAASIAGYSMNGVITNTATITLIAPQAGDYYLSYNFLCNDGTRTPNLQINGGASNGGQDITGASLPATDFTGAATFASAKWQWCAPKLIKLKAGTNTINIYGIAASNSGFVRLGGVFITSKADYTLASINSALTLANAKALAAPNINVIPSWGAEQNILRVTSNTLNDITVSWPSAKYAVQVTAKPLYQIIDRATNNILLTTTKKSLAFTDLPSLSDLALTIKASNGFGGAAESHDITVKTDLITADTTTSLAGATFANLANRASEEKTVTLIVAAYDVNNRIVAYKAVNKKMTAKQTIASFDLNFDTAAPAGSTVKTFIWNDMQNMNPVGRTEPLV